MAQSPQDKIKVLFFAANPSGTNLLALDEEAREIEAKVRASEHRDALELITKWATRPDDLLQFTNQHLPTIVHFSGHGSTAGEIFVLDKNRQPKPVEAEALAALFWALKGKIRVVFLNACWTQPQAEAIVQVIDCAIGMSRAVGDQAAITFAASFYRALGFGVSVQNAFDQAKAALMLESIPEAGTPQLLTRRGADPSKIILVNPGRDDVSRPGIPAGDGSSRQSGARMEVFYSYSHRDERLREQLENHLAALKREGVITGWHDRKIRAGTEWQGQIDEHLNTASVILLLVSSNFLGSDYCYDVELRRALERHAAGEARVIPIILRPVDWHGTAFARLQALPKDGKPVTKWSNRDEAFLDVAQGIRRAVKELRNPS
jgi:hypothetical protein